jgi:hypothetical protein
VREQVAAVKRVVHRRAMINHSAVALLTTVILTGHSQSANEAAPSREAAAAFSRRLLRT